MSTQDTPTKWVGTYSYNPVLGTLQQSSVSFTMQIEIGWFGRFKGWIDEDESGIPERATISGTMRGGRIRFKKQYKSNWSVDNNGKSVVLAGLKPHVVHYEGTLDSNNSAIKGSWKIKAQPNAEINGMEYEFPESTGTWNATEQSV